MAATAAEGTIAGTDSGNIDGSPEFMNSLVEEANRSLKRLSAVGLRVDQVWEKDSAGGMNPQEAATFLHLLPREDMEDLVRRVRNIESLLLDAT